jgi:hypothetical protein
VSVPCAVEGDAHCPLCHFPQPWRG